MFIENIFSNGLLREYFGKADHSSNETTGYAHIAGTLTNALLSCQQMALQHQALHEQYTYCKTSFELLKVEYDEMQRRLDRARLSIQELEVANRCLSEENQSLREVATIKKMPIINVYANQGMHTKEPSMHILVHT